MKRLEKGTLLQERQLPKEPKTLDVPDRSRARAAPVLLEVGEFIVKLDTEQLEDFLYRCLE